MNTAANRGKYAESELKKYLKLLESHHMDFTWNRNPDAHAAGGKFVPVAGDFQAFHKLGWAYLRNPENANTYTERQVPYQRNFIIEVKEVKHDFRLPVKNYSSDKIARIEKRVRAGTEAAVLICHWPKTEKETWRLVPHEFFQDQSQPSWDLRRFPICDWKRELSDFLGVLP